MAWQCGKCDGFPVPEHHRTCPRRTSPVPVLTPIVVQVKTVAQVTALRELLRSARRCV